MKRFGIFLLLFIFMITACGNEKVKEANTIDNFKSTAEGYGFTVKDNKSSYSNVNYVTDSMIAELNDISLEMVIYDTEENAINVQDGHINQFLKLKSTGVSINKDKGANYYSYVMISNGYYMVSSRIGNTLIFAKTLLENKEHIENVLNAVGY